MREEPAWQRLDLHVIVAALLLIVLGWFVQRRGGSGETKEVARAGVRVVVPADWIAEPSATGPLVVRGEDAITRLEIRKDEIGSDLVGVSASLDLARARRYGDLYQKANQARVEAGGTAWLRTEFSYAFKPTPTHAPRVATAIEYATPADGPAANVSVVTLHAPEQHVEALEHAILGTITKEAP